MKRFLPQRVYSGPVKGEVVVQGDLSAQGDINIVIDSARTAYRTVIESPQTFGPMQTKVQDAIKTLLVVSEMTSQYLNEGRLDGNLEQELAQLSQDCRNHLVELQNTGQEIETMDTQALRQNDLGKLTDSLETKVKGLEDINGRVIASVIQLEKALKKYIAQVKDGERASSIRSGVSSNSLASTISQKEWRQIQKELESVGITAAQFNNNRERVLGMLSDAFQKDVEENSLIRMKEAGQPNRLLSSLSTKSRNLLAAAEKGNIEQAKDLLTKGANVDTQNSNGFTPLHLAVEKQNFELAQLFLSYKADVDTGAKPKNLSLSPLIRAVEDCNLMFIKLLLDHGANINKPRSENMSPLHVAVEGQDIGIINALLDRGADVSAKSYQEPATALGMAIDQDSFDIIRTLVKHGSKVNQTLSYTLSRDETPISFAIILARLTSIQKVSRNETPISFAIRKGNFHSIQYLLQNGARVANNTLETAIEMGNTKHLRLLLTHHRNADLSTLALAASRARNQHALHLLIHKGADVNTSTRVEQLRVPRYFVPDGQKVYNVETGGETLVWLAAAAGHYRVLDLLLAKGANIEKRAYPKRCREHRTDRCLFARKHVKECTAVQMAVSHGHWNCARLLVRRGGDLNAWVTFFLGVSKRLLHLVIDAPVGLAENLRPLADMGADLDIENHRGQTLLHILPWSTENRGERISLARALVANSAKVNYRDYTGRTPLHLAVGVFSRDHELIEFLLENGANPNAKDERGSTPLHYAGKLRDERAFRALAKAGGKADIVDDKNRTPQSLYDDFTERPGGIIKHRRIQHGSVRYGQVGHFLLEQAD